VAKGLITIAKVLQAIANGVEYEPESYMSCFNHFISNTTPIYLQFVDNIVVCSTASLVTVLSHSPLAN
jgi:hypothetical protein